MAYDTFRRINSDIRHWNTFLERKQTNLSQQHPPSNNFVHIHPSKLLYTHTCIKEHTNKIRLPISSTDKVLSQQINDFRFISQTTLAQCWIQTPLFLLTARSHDEEPLLEDHRNYIPSKNRCFHSTFRVWKYTD